MGWGGWDVGEGLVAVDVLDDADAVAAAAVSVGCAETAAPSALEKTPPRLVEPKKVGSSSSKMTSSESVSAWFVSLDFETSKSAPESAACGWGGDASAVLEVVSGGDTAVGPTAAGGVCGARGVDTCSGAVDVVGAKRDRSVPETSAAGVILAAPHGCCKPSAALCSATTQSRDEEMWRVCNHVRICEPEPQPVTHDRQCSSLVHMRRRLQCDS